MNFKTSSQTREHRLIENIVEWTGSRLIGDDCAILPQGRLVSVDSLIESTHFNLSTTDLSDLGWKSVAVNLSDIAAMAGRPRQILISVGFNPSMSDADLKKLFCGMAECARTYRVQVAGGDLVKSPFLAITITVIGDGHEHGILRRSGARPGDIVVVTGDFGASRAGLFLLEEGCKTRVDQPVSIDRKNFGYCINRHLKPMPRLCESWALNRSAFGRGALMDASDGLADALFQISRASGWGMQIDLKKVPVHQETVAVAKKAACDPLDWMLYGGEDYELVGCISSSAWSRLNELSGESNPFTEIGRVQENREMQLLLGQDPGPALDLEKSYQHTRVP
ncbi:MAG: thiamine-phosphate kinase [Candidatus Obscuribacterales bacterium]|nr:thiamine-phosphate kinase [Candidatus Obscuribacterales bacterium]